MTTLSLAPRNRWLALQQRTLDFLQRHSPPSKLPPHLVTGLRGEQAALFHLRALGFTVVAQRWVSAQLRGDLDLVAWDGDTLVIFEIKTRTARDFAPADTAVDRAKQKHLRRMADAYVRQFPRADRDRIHLRFDLLSVYLLPTVTEFEHFADVFPRNTL